MSFKSLPGECVLLPKKTGAIELLWVVLTSPDENSEVVIVNLTSFDSGFDRTVILNKGDHSFVDHDTIINYVDARIVKAHALIHAAESGFFDSLEPFKADILQKIQEGLFRSPHTPIKVKNFCKGKIDP